MIDLTPATRRVSDLVAAIPDDRLGAPTPCEKYSVAELLTHIDGLALAFTRAATKDPAIRDSPPASSAPPGLPDGWRTRIPERLTALAEAWRDPSAWQGMTAAGGVDLPGEVAGLVALDEVVVHGWDLARATDRPYVVSDDEAAACMEFVSQAPTDDDPGDPGLFGPPVDVPDTAPPLERLIARTGRDPEWTPPA